MYPNVNSLSLYICIRALGIACSFFLKFYFKVATREANEWVKAESEKKYNVRMRIYIYRIINLKSVPLSVVVSIKDYFLQIGCR